MKDTTALITGASGGIGYELAKLLARDCSLLILVARSKDRLENVKKELETSSPARVRVIAADLSGEGAAEKIHRELEQEKISVDILVNNAGFGGHGAFIDRTWKEDKALIDVNVRALTQLTKLFAPAMVARKKGRILNLASTASFQPGPFQAVYYASKAYVLFLSEALANELRGTGVTVTALCPGPTLTGFAAAASLEQSRLFRYLPKASARDVARFGYDAMMKGEAVAVPGLVNKLGVFGVRLGPRKLLAAIVRWLHETG